MAGDRGGDGVRASRRRRAALGCSLGFLLLAGIGLLFVRARYGGETIPFPDRSTEPLLPASALEVVARLAEAPGNLAVAPDGTIFFNFHPEGRPTRKVMRLRPGEAPTPWPDASWQRRRGEGEPFFDGVFSLRIDGQGRLWTLDPAFHGLGQVRLLAFDWQTGQLLHRYDLPRSVAPRGSYVQDFQVSPDGSTIFMADLGFLNRRPALIVYDIEGGGARRRLERHPSVLAKPYAIVTPQRRMRLLGGLLQMHPDVDSIVLDRRGEWLYYGPMSHETLFRVPAAALADFDRSEESLAARIEAYGPKPQSDGLAIDENDRIYVTAVERQGLAVLDPDRKLRTLVRHPDVRWLDGLSFGPDGWLYATDSALPDVMLRSRGHRRASAPYVLWRLQTAARPPPGH